MTAEVDEKKGDTVGLRFCSRRPMTEDTLGKLPADARVYVDATKSSMNTGSVGTLKKSTVAHINVAVFLPGDATGCAGAMRMKFKTDGDMQKLWGMLPGSKMSFPDTSTMPACTKEA